VLRLCRVGDDSNRCELWHCAFSQFCLAHPRLDEHPVAHDEIANESLALTPHLRVCVDRNRSLGRPLDVRTPPAIGPRDVHAQGSARKRPLEDDCHFRFAPLASRGGLALASRWRSDRCRRGERNDCESGK